MLYGPQRDFFMTKSCVIGAGSSGLATAKTLAESGLAFDCFELGSGIGGN
jgi:cation diffusion facilitator CzcD-associated flavoprotein CzcO